MSAIQSEISLSRRQAAALLRFLSSHQVHLESTITASEPIIDLHGNVWQVTPNEGAPVVTELRRQWREAEDLKLAVEQQLCRREVPKGRA